MADRIAVSCSNCGAGLKIDAEKVGKKLKCPKCSEVFVAAAEDNFDDEEPAADPEPRRKSQPAAGGRSGGKGKKAPAKKGGGGMVIALVGGGVALLLILGVVGLIASGAFSKKTAAPANEVAAADADAASADAPAAGTAASSPTAAPAVKTAAATTPAVPAKPLIKPDLVLTLRPVDFWNAPLIAALRADPLVGGQLESVKQPFAQFGIDPTTDVEAINLIGWNMSQSQSGSSMPALTWAMGAPNLPGAAGTPPDKTGANRPKMIFSLSFVQEFPLSQLAEKLQNQADNPLEVTPGQSEKGATLTVRRQDGMNMGLGNVLMFAQVSPKAIVIGEKENVEPLISVKDEKASPFDLQFARDINDRTGNPPGKAPQFSLIVRNLQPGTPTPETSSLPPGTPAAVAALQPALQQDMSSLGLSLRIEGGVQLESIVMMKDAEKAAALLQNLSQAVEDGRTQYGEVKGGLPPFATELLDPLLAGITVKDAKSAVQIKASIPDSSQAQLAQLPTKIMGYMLTAGMNRNGPGGALPGLAPPGMSSPLPVIPAPKSPIPTGSLTFPAVEATNLPEGMSLVSQLYLKPTPAERAGQPGMQLAVALVLQGLPPDTPYLQLGKIAFKKINANGKQPLKPNQVFVNVLKPRPEGEVLSLSDFPFTPEGDLLIGEALILPPRYAVNVLSAVEGTFLVRTGQVVEDFSVANASAKEGEPAVDSDALKNAGVKVRVETGKVKNALGRLTETVTVTANKGFAFGKLELADAAGLAVPGTMVAESAQSGEPVWRVFIDRETKLPPGLTLKGKLIGAIEEHAVAFQFQDLTMPAASAGGQAPVDGQPAAPLNN